MWGELWEHGTKLARDVDVFGQIRSICMHSPSPVPKAAVVGRKRSELLLHGGKLGKTYKSTGYAEDRRIVSYHFLLEQVSFAARDVSK